MSRFNVMPRAIDPPDLHDNELALLVIDNHGNYVANTITKQAIAWAEPPALHHLLKELVAKLDAPHE